MPVAWLPRTRPWSLAPGGGSRLPSCVCHPSLGITLFSRALVPFLGADIRDQELGVTRDSALVSGHERHVLPVPWSGAQCTVGRKAGRQAGVARSGSGL